MQNMMLSLKVDAISEIGNVAKMTARRVLKDDLHIYA
jgi:hypothetical protein